MTEVQQQVDLILLHRITSTRKCEYLVQWGDEQQTWEVGSNLSSSEELLASYWRGYVERAGNSSYLEQVVNLALIKETLPQAKKSKAIRKPVDKITVAKRVQAAKHLNGSLKRSRGETSSIAPVARPPPKNAKRSKGSLGHLSVSETTSSVEKLDISTTQKHPIQRARKSTGGRRPPPLT
ncbi:hypothetical protein COEREDRAFT_81508 [Coemansia reversa NRRL 1564]|uniref:Chromo domain-containing protein n=1 Tax=Coemansia reversa (strain ATCC 12441 / NRRL 1564) TaxID=763665 RepID=A0A2G5BAP1_COERN|nr:hypothetical protein COEREDRAFT_81508 [Coemansia reversa NRRL 1564]|eukprot:PIA16062.1 hypothetical protein COEREDRAFT_81508 [Coemansia reversa NRRL 1564]